MSSARPRLSSDFVMSAIITVAVFCLVFYYLGLQALLTTLVLMIIEIIFSFDNAIINARTLTEMSPFWRRMFMTIGVVIAVFGMRIVFPILIVIVTTGLSWGQVVYLALQEPEKYASALERAHSSIGAFGGMFLLTLALNFFFDATREINWLHRIEKPLQAASRKGLHLFGSILVLGVVVFLSPDSHQTDILLAGGMGIIAYAAVHGLSEVMEAEHRRAAKPAGKIRRRVVTAGLASFIYLEVLDASFSLDGVIGAFAVTKDVILIAAGLAAGAIWVRSLTLFIVHRKLLRTYRYLEHAAHYIIGALAVALLLGLFYDVSEMYVGIMGILLIGAAVISSIKDNKRDDRNKLL